MEMNNECPECNASFEPEPGFYFGAMFISYAFAVAIIFITWLFLWVFIQPASTIYIYAILGNVLLFTPFSYRYSRLIWLYWFGGHTRHPQG